MENKKILLIEPYYGGSHKRFLDGLTTFVTGDYTLLSLPARKWKMRMQLGAPWFIERVKSMAAGDRLFDIVLFSSFIDVAVFKAMAASVDGWNRQCKYFTYFHENQFSYPGFLDKQTNHQFTVINFTTALVSDSVAFNSEFNRTSFFKQSKKYLSKATDIDLVDCLDQLVSKSVVLYPGLDFNELDQIDNVKDAGEDKLIIWNHRWEHDKNPEEFFETLIQLHDDNVDFRLCVLGENFKDIPACFTRAEGRLGERIVYFGYVEDRGDYHSYLRSGAIVVSTSIHEFFGMSVIEAVRAGCLPVLPKRLSYPELFDDSFLYEEGCLYEHLRHLLQTDTNLSIEQARQMTEPYSWKHLAAQYRQWLH